MKSLVLSLTGLMAAMIFAGCATTEPEPIGPQSESSDMPWNTPQPGEGSAAFGGLLSEGR